MLKDIAEWKGGRQEQQRRQCRYPAMLSRRIRSAEPDLDLLNDKESINKAQRNATQSGSKETWSAPNHSCEMAQLTKDTESRCRTMDGRRATSC